MPHRHDAKAVSHPRLSPREVRWAGLAVTAIFPDADGIELAVPLERLMAGAPPRAVLGVRAAIWLAYFAPLFVLRRARTLEGIEASARPRVIGALLASPLYAVRQLALLLKMLGAFVVACVPSVRAELVSRRVAPPPLESGPRLVGEAALVRPRESGGARGRRIA